MTAARWPRYLAALLGFVWYLQLGGGPTLNPTHIGWLLSGDWRQHWLGWLFFRSEPWTFPLGTMTSLLYPIGTSIGFTDSNPLLSLLLKPFSGLLPFEFQFIGPWLAFCFAMQGYMGATLTSTVSKDSGQQLLGGYLFVLSPVLVGRMGHDTLCAQWILLGLLYLGLRDYVDARRALHGAWLALAAVLLSASIHPYLTAMAFALALGCYARLWRARLIGARAAALFAAGTAAGMIAVFGTIGYLGSAQVGSSGWGQFSADVVALINPAGFSKTLPSFNLRGEWEGLGFLGLGGLVAVVMGLAARWRPRTGGRERLRPGVWVVVTVCALLAVFALSETVHLAGTQVARMHTFYKWFPFLTQPFRASGRFIWPLHYLVMLFGIWGTTRLLGSARQSAGTALLAMAVVLQAADLKTDPAQLADKHFRLAPAKDLALAVGHYRHMAVFPMQVLGTCADPYEDDRVYRFMLLAYQLHLTYNSGIFARQPGARVGAECTRLEQEVDAGTLDPETIYVVSPNHVPRFDLIGASCGRWDGDWLCVSRDSYEPFRQYVSTGRIK